MAVERSLHGYWLAYSGQRWVGTMLRGLNWTWGGMSVLGAIVVLLWLAAIGQLGETRQRMRAELVMSTAAGKEDRSSTEDLTDGV